MVSHLQRQSRPVPMLAARVARRASSCRPTSPPDGPFEATTVTSPVNARTLAESLAQNTLTPAWKPSRSTIGERDGRVGFDGGHVSPSRSSV